MLQLFFMLSAVRNAWMSGTGVTLAFSDNNPVVIPRPIDSLVVGVPPDSLTTQEVDELEMPWTSSKSPEPRSMEIIVDTDLRTDSCSIRANNDEVVVRPPLLQAIVTPGGPLE